MFRTYYLVAAVGLPLLLAGCGEVSSPPSESGIEPTQASAARVSAAAVERFRFQIRQEGANAFFSTSDPSGCVNTFVDAFGAEQTRKEGPGKPTTGPLAVVQVFQFDSCTGEVLRDIFSESGDATFQVGNKLTEARLQATIPAFDFAKQVEVQVVVDLAWTAVGAPVSQSDRFRLKAPAFMLTQWLKGTFRAAEVSGTVAVGGDNVATDALDASIFRARSGFFERVRTGEVGGAQARLPR